MLFAGLDVSTQSCKLLVIDGAKKDVVLVETINYDRDLPQYNTLNGVTQGMGRGVSESDPLMWIEAIERIFTKLQKQNFPFHEIKCIAVSGQQHGLVALDERAIWLAQQASCGMTFRHRRNAIFSRKKVAVTQKWCRKLVMRSSPDTRLRRFITCNAMSRKTSKRLKHSFLCTITSITI